MYTKPALFLLLQVAIITSASPPSNNKTGDSNSSDLNPAETAFYNSYVNVNNFPGSYSYSSSDHYNGRFPSIVDRNSSVCGSGIGQQCQQSRYRSYDGSCNNLEDPTWGAANTRYSRLVRPIYSDGISEPAVSVTGEPLPLSRKLSFTLFPSINIKDKVWTLATMQWGQLIVHDMALIGSSSNQDEKQSPPCCTKDGQLSKRSCQAPSSFPIVIPHDDPVYAPAGTECLSFDRSLTDLDLQCNQGDRPAEQLNTVTHYLDGSEVYGSTEEKALELRAMVAGRMRVDFRNNREWPPQVANSSAVCDVDYNQEVCYDMGDSRANQNPQLTVLQIIMLREHNRIADELTRLNPHWDDETTYQETRRIVIAELQHISYYEWLPIIIGEANSYHYKILYKTDNYVNDYDPSVDPSVINEHSTAANRYFHTLVAGYLKLIDENRGVNGKLRLSDWFDKPSVLEQHDNFNDLARGLAFQPESDSDKYFTEEITNYLRRRKHRLGSDLRAIDIQRNRDHGLGSYNDLREYCGLRRAKTWLGFAPLISPLDIARLAELYENPDDVDLTVGGSLELHVPGTLAGPTFLCILIEQHYRTRVGDRYWYETGDPEIAFTVEQLQEIRKATISRLLCDNGDDITRMQPEGFRLVSLTNRIKPCSELPKVNLRWWKDYSQKNSGKSRARPSYRK